MTGAHDAGVRPARREDVELLVEFNAAMALETEDRELDRDVLARGVEAVLDDPARGAYWVAEPGDGGAVLGALMVTKEWSDWRAGEFWWVQSVYVRPEVRGRGVYSALYRHLHAAARADAGVCGLRLYVERENTRAQAIYEKLGMRRSDYLLYEDDFVLPAGS